MEGSRAASNLNDFYEHFLVRTLKTKTAGATEVVMPNYDVAYDKGTEHYGSHWYYDGIGDQSLKYWDLSAQKYTFAAVTPLPDPESSDFAYKDTKVTIDDYGEITITGIKGNMSSVGDGSANSSNAPAWMVARTVRTNGAEVTDDDALDADHMFHYDAQQRPTNVAESLHATVPLLFHHIFARVDFKAYSAQGQIVLSKFKVMIPEASSDEIINQGNYTTHTNDGGIIGWTNTTAETNAEQDPKRFGDYTYLGGKTIPEGSENPALLASHIQIPHHWLAEGRKFIVTLEATDGTVYTGTITLTKDNNGEYEEGADYSGWKQGVHYTYILKIDAEGANEVILFSVDMDKWKWTEGNSTEDEQHNW